MFRTPSRLSLLTAAALVLLVPSLLDAGLFRGRCAVVPCPPPPECAPVPPEVAIRAVLDAQVAAWNKGDLDGFMEGYWNSPDLSFYSGRDKKKGWKETRDRYMRRADSAHPGWEFAQHVGYSTPEHREAIERLGVSPLHRLSFQSMAYQQLALEEAAAFD